MLKVIYDRARYLMRPRKYNMQKCKAQDKKGIIWVTNFLIPQRNICCGYSLEASHRDASNEHHNNCFRCEIRKLLPIFIEKFFLSKRMENLKVTKCNQD